MRKSKQQQKQRLEERLASLDGNEKNKLYKRAARLRKAQHAPQRRSRPRAAHDWQEWSEEEQDDARDRRRPPAAARTRSSLDDLVSELLAEEESAPTRPGETTEQPGPSSATGLDAGVVVEVGAGSCVVVADGQRRDCVLADAIAATQKSSIAVGDEVLVAAREEAEFDRVEQVLPRRSLLSRPDPSGKRVAGVPLERAIAANIDRVVVVASIQSPPLKPRLIDRYLVAIERGGAEAAICLTKIDLASEAELSAAQEALGPYRELGVPVLPCSAADAIGLDRVRATIAGELIALVGHSGVGKSSLLNALAPDCGADTGGVTDYRGRGRHTTTSSTLYQIGDGTRIIDTPGIRQFGLMKLSRDELRTYFPELAAPATGCRFHNCSHSHEPDCAVRRAVTDGTLPALRYDTYLRLLGELPPADPG